MTCTSSHLLPLCIRVRCRIPFTSRFSRTMSSSNHAPITISSLTYLSAKDLAPLLLDQTTASKIAVIDVRDSDHIGGNIKDSHWIPLHQLDTRIPELLRTMKDKDRVVFHCMLSQQRGPRAALMYARAKQRAELKVTEESEDGAIKQEVCVLEGGFGSWQARFGEDPRLTANYQQDLWQ